ncbi:hypothetical protein GCM10010313_37740 [Streptomyces violarus]|uniref:Uncharacterized protein n=1 Tax=Streptomyces violarus TaxID=67380 RepID=A0A7W4ZYT8_9ACTN|nr:hypothetical protein [Streptomyces violarus]GHD13189.1 hypothetical protein GCM10010313_37740 [Streptomyces violarus]
MARLCTCGAELVVELDQYKNIYRLCYVHGPGEIIALAEQITFMATRPASADRAATILFRAGGRRPRISAHRTDSGTGWISSALCPARS